MAEKSCFEIKYKHMKMNFQIAIFALFTKNIAQKYF